MMMMMMMMMMNWFSFHIVIMKVIRVNFFETQCKYIAAQAFYKTNIHAPWTVLRTALFSVIIAPVG